MMRQQRAQHAHFARSSDVDDIRTEGSQRLRYQRQMAGESEIVTQVFVESKGEQAPSQFEGGYGCLVLEWFGTIPGAHT